MIEAIELTKSYNGRVVVDHVSLKIPLGRIVGLLGANGAGKTTTFQMIVGLIRASSGKILETGPPEKIAASEKVRRLYLGENFKFIKTGNNRALAENVGELSHEA